MSSRRIVIGKKRLTRKRGRSSKDATQRSKLPKFEDFDAVFSYYTSLGEFCIGGELELTANSSKLFYKSSNGSMEVIDFLNILKKNVDLLAASCSLSSFGRGRKSVVDVNVRQAKELKATDFSFQFNPQMSSNVTSQIQQLLGGREFIMEPYKLNIYPEGGHFKRHKDTLKNDKMIASLVVCLPIPFEGGVLTVENEKGLSVNFDWGKEIRESSTETNKIQWACFFCSCDHFISPVTKGNRVTIAYDIFRNDSVQNIRDKKTRPITENLRENCIADLHNLVKNLNVNVKYGYFPNHVYSFGVTDATNKDTRDKLKGNDLILFDILKEYGWTVILQVCYPVLKSYGEFLSTLCFGEYVDENEKWKARTNREFKLRKLSTLKLMNKQGKCHMQKIKKFAITGNEPVYDWAYVYGGTIMILRHESFIEEDIVEVSGDEGLDDTDISSLASDEESEKDEVSADVSSEEGGDPEED